MEMARLSQSRRRTSYPLYFEIGDKETRLQDSVPNGESKRMGSKSILEKASEGFLTRKGLHLLLCGQGLPWAFRITDRNHASQFKRSKAYQNLFGSLKTEEI